MNQYDTSLESIKKIGQEVILKGWVNARRDMGKVVFFDLRDRAGIMHVYRDWETDRKSVV